MANLDVETLPDNVKRELFVLGLNRLNEILTGFDAIQQFNPATLRKHAANCRMIGVTSVSTDTTYGIRLHGASFRGDTVLGVLAVLDGELLPRSYAQCVELTKGSQGQIQVKCVK